MKADARVRSRAAIGPGGALVRGGGALYPEMMSPALRLGLTLSLAVGCGPKSDLTASAGDLSSGASTDEEVTVGHGSSPTTGVTTSPPPPPPSTTAPGTTATSLTATATDGTTDAPDPTSTTTSTTTTDVPCSDPPGQPLDSPCVDASGCGCASGRCFVVPALGGLCGECLTDADCPGGGCTAPNPVQGVGSRCNDGSPADGCMSDEACTSDIAPHCGLVLEVPGIISVSTCGQCETDGDCDPAEPICTPMYDIPDFTGVLVCKAVGAVPDDQGCSLAPGGEAACASGICAQASVMGLLFLGVCSACDGDEDCQPGQSCTDAQIDLDAGVLIGSVCQ